MCSERDRLAALPESQRHEERRRLWKVLLSEERRRVMEVLRVGLVNRTTGQPLRNFGDCAVTSPPVPSLQATMMSMEPKELIRLFMRLDLDDCQNNECPHHPNHHPERLRSPPTSVVSENPKAGEEKAKDEAIDIESLTDTSSASSWVYLTDSPTLPKAEPGSASPVAIPPVSTSKK